jgi:hypothetical protein
MAAPDGNHGAGPFSQRKMDGNVAEVSRGVAKSLQMEPRRVAEALANAQEKLVRKLR